MINYDDDDDNDDVDDDDDNDDGDGNDDVFSKNYFFCRIIIAEASLD